jgi:tetratricopeptide (TPR) repeat protein
MAIYSDEILAEAKKYFIDGNYKVAEPILQQLVLQGNRNPEIYQMLATIFYDKGLFNKAIKTFRRALEIDPTYTDASVGLSIILNDLGRYQEGQKVFEEAQDLLKKRQNKSDPYFEEKLATKHEELAELYSQINRHSEALEQLFKAQKLSSRKPEISLRIADTFAKIGDSERAIRELRSLLKDYPHLVPARLKLGLVYFNNNNLAEASEQWESVLMRDPENPEATRLLRMAQAAGITSISL